MSRVAVSYNGTSIQTSSIVTQEIEHESIDGKSLDIQGLAARDGAKLLAATFKPRKITLRGYIKASSQSALETAIDDFKELLNATTKNLDIGYAGGTRRYVCDMASITLMRQHFNVTFAEWEAEFICAKMPFGKTLDTTTVGYTLTSIGTYAGSYVALGSYSPNPKIIITFSEVATVTRIRIRNITTGDQMDIDNNNTYANNDEVVVDCDDKTVTLNGVAWDYSGYFPSFQSAGNDLRISFSPGVHYKATVNIVYYPLYL